MATTEPLDELRFLTVRELAAYLRISLRKAYALVESGEVPAARVGGQFRIPREELDRRLAHSMKRPAGVP
jgi:excisionase family DNA binding protein